jgi:hypothetical protein
MFLFHATHFSIFNLNQIIGVIRFHRRRIRLKESIAHQRQPLLTDSVAMVSVVRSTIWQNLRWPSKTSHHIGLRRRHWNNRANDNPVAYSLYNMFQSRVCARLRVAAKYGLSELEYGTN